jgi:hypothetical protein
VSFPTSVENYPAILLGFGRRKAIGNSTPTGQSCYSFLAGDVPRVCVCAGVNQKWSSSSRVAWARSANPDRRPSPRAR